MQGSVKYYPVMDGGDSLVTENPASLLQFLISPVFVPRPEIENGSDTASSRHLSPSLGTRKYFSNLEQNILTK